MKLPNLFSKISLLLLIIFCINKSVISQTSFVGHLGTVPATDWCGWNAATIIPFNLENRGTNNINFLTGGAQRMTILGTASANPGFVGIGLPTPLFRLDVQDNISVNTANSFGRGYWIDGFTVLQIPGVENTFVGRGAGANTVLTPLAENTFVGFQAGGSNVAGVRNTYVGRAAGFAMVNGRFNTFVGADAGLNLAVGNANTFIGEHSGWQQIAGDNNTYVGSHSGSGTPNSTGTNNTFLGMNCGPNNVNGNSNTFTGVMAGNNCSTGDQNSFYGVWAGLQTNAGSGNVAMGFRTNRFNHGGNNNTFVGTDAGVPGAAIFWGLTNANGFGSNAIARASNTMILGDNSVFVGIGLSNDNVQNGPQNKLEIDAGLNGFNPSLPATVGASGLTFRDLHSGNATLPVNGVALSVNGSGEVILVPAGGPNSFASCSGPIPALASNVAMDLNNFNLHFSGTTTNSRVGIGTSCPSVLLAKFNVVESSGVTTGSLAARIANTNNSVSGQVFGIVSTLNPTAPSPSDIGYTAGFFIASASKRCVGVEGRANGLVINGAANYGGYFSAQNGGVNTGVFAQAPVSPSDYAAWFEGNMLFNGTLSGTNNVMTSDQIFKTNISSVQNATQLILSLQPKSYYFDTLNQYGMNFSIAKQYGLVAQDVEQILPELVGQTYKPERYDSTTQTLYPALIYKNLNYNAFIAILIKGMQEQQAQIDSLSAQINSCCNSNARTQNPNINQTDITLSNSESVVLNQNVPNPFAEQTTITYNLPESVQKAQLLFYDATGKLIKAVDLTARGNGQINVFANDLSNGIYSYALVVDGQIADTKRMVKTN